MYDVRVFKSLDKKNSFLGLKGDYFRIMCIALACCLGVAILLAPFVGDFLAVAIFLVLGIIAWAVVMRLQGNYSERELKRILSCRNLPQVIEVQPRSFYAQSKYHDPASPLSHRRSEKKH